MRFLAAWIVYAAGDLVGRFERFGWFYPLYSRLMVWSNRIQDDGKGPWNRRLRNWPVAKAHRFPR